MSNNEILFNSEGSYTDYDYALRSKSAPPAEKRIITEDVPFGNGYYDFSAATGSIHYSEREVEYELAYTAASVSDRVAHETDLAEWLYGINGSNWSDSLISGTHYVGTCTGVSFNSDAGLQSVAKVTFKAQPMRVDDIDPTDVTPC